MKIDIKKERRKEMKQSALSGKYTKPSWAAAQKEYKGAYYDICEHGYMHPNEKWLQENNLKDPDGRDYSIHRCDGCCSKFARDIRNGKISANIPEEVDASKVKAKIITHLNKH